MQSISPEIIFRGDFAWEKSLPQINKLTKKIIIKVQSKIKFNLLYDKKASLQKKIKLEQIRRETN